MQEIGNFIFFLIALAIGIFVFISMWKVYEKAGKPGWAAIIPLYNLIVLLQIAGKPLWWLLLFFIPILNAIFYCIVQINLARSFGRSGAFGFFFLFLFGFIGYPILGFGNSQYLGTSNGGNQTPIATPTIPPIATPSQAKPT